MRDPARQGLEGQEREGGTPKSDCGHPAFGETEGRRNAMVTPGVPTLERRQDITLINAVALAFWWRRMLGAGQRPLPRTRQRQRRSTPRSSRACCG